MLLSRLALCGLAATLAACGSQMVRVHRIDIQQGNLVTQEMVTQLRPGLTREQVRYLLGSPLVTDIFHADRWDYVYLYKPGYGEPQSRRISVFFEGERLARVAGDVVAADGSAEQPVDAVAKPKVIEVPGPQPKAPVPAPAEAGAGAPRQPGE